MQIKIFKLNKQNERTSGQHGMFGNCINPFLNDTLHKIIYRVYRNIVDIIAQNLLTNSTFLWLRMHI